MKQTAKKQALYLINQYLPFVADFDSLNGCDRDEKSILEDAKKVATMNVNEILMALYENKCLDACFHWEEVKQEIARF